MIIKVGGDGGWGSGCGDGDNGNGRGRVDWLHWIAMAGLRSSVGTGIINSCEWWYSQNQVWKPVLAVFQDFLG